jgi:hypothetical protein
MAHAAAAAAHTNAAGAAAAAAAAAFGYYISFDRKQSWQAASRRRPHLDTLRRLACVSID